MDSIKYIKIISVLLLFTGMTSCSKNDEGEENKEINNAYNSFCPNDNHPHMIDLGLPSGTMWACCNVGASAPEQYGNYYAWGETQPKNDYHADKYQYAYYDYENMGGHMMFYYIGSDIAGTSYDAATANWGAPWHMPSSVLCMELINSCISVWTTLNGVNGRKFTGPNGSTIFLPAAGSRSNTELWGASMAGSRGDFWSSTEYDVFCAWEFCFDSGKVETYEFNRGWGLSVRPVIKGNIVYKNCPDKKHPHMIDLGLPSGTK